MMLPIPTANVLVRSVGITGILYVLTMIASRWRGW